MLIGRRHILAAALVLLGVSSARADALDDIKTRGTLIVGVEAGGTGAILSQDPQGHDVGLDADINALVAEKLGVKLQMVDVDWSGIIPALLAKRFDMILCGMTATKQRAEKVSFSTPYGNSSFVLVSRADDKRIKSPADLSGRTIGLQVASPGFDFLKGQDASLKAAGLAPMQPVKVYDDVPSLFGDLANQRIDGLLLPYPIVIGYVSKQPNVFRIATDFEEKSYFAAALRKEDPNLLKAVNEILVEAKKDGTIAKLQAKWLGASSGPLPDSWAAAN